MTDRREVQKAMVVGPGWLGGAVAHELAAKGMLVWTVQRSAPEATPGAHCRFDDGRIAALQGDIRLDGPDTQHDAWQHAWREALPASFDHLVVCVAPSREAGDDHTSTYPAALRGALALADERDCRNIVYTSSTGVYGRSDGAVSRETDEIQRRDARQGALLDAEDVLADQSIARGTRRTILRVAGLYGPGRDPAGRFRTTIPTGDQDVWCNFSWRDDVVSAIAHVLAYPAAAGTLRRFNCADGTPIRASVVARALGASASASASASRSTTPSSGRPTSRSNQRIPIDALRATGWAPSKPTVLDGLAALGHRVDRTVLTDAAR